MTRYITTAVISVFIAATLIFGQRFIEGSCAKLTELTDAAARNIAESDFPNAEKNIKNAIKLLKKDENFHFALSDHEAYDELTATLKVSAYLVSQKEKSLAGAYLTLARDEAEKLKDSQSFGIGNIL